MLPNPLIPVEAEVERKVLAILYENSRQGHKIHSLLCAFVAVAVFLADDLHAWHTPLFWLLGMLLRDLADYIHATAWQSVPRSIADTPRGFRRFALTVLSQAIGWSVGIILFMPGASHELTFFLLTIATGMTAGAVPMLAGDMRLISMFVGTLFGTIAIVLGLYSHSDIGYLLLACIPIYAIAIYTSANLISQTLTNSLRLSIERLALLDSLRKAHLEVARTSQAKSEFLANMSHEVRTPLSAIIGFSELALSAQNPDATNTRLSVIRRAAHSLLEVLNGVLDFSRIEAGKMKMERIPFRLPEVLDTLEAIYGKTAAEKGLYFRAERSPMLPVCLEGDPIHLHQVLANLLGNAIKFTPSGGLVVKVEPLSLSPDDGQTSILFSVQDTGIGIDKAQQALIFEAFAQADTSASRRFSGTGLGLTIARNLVRLMGGTGLQLVSAFGEGSRFSFALPFGWLPNDAVRPAIQDIPELPTGEPNGKHLLLAEDYEENQNYYSFALTRAGYKVTIAGNGAEALRQCAIQTFHAVLMDVQMPVMDGLEATRRIREREHELGLPRTPVVILTGDIREDRIADYQAAGSDSHLVKPVQISTLLEVIEHLREQDCALAENPTAD